MASASASASATLLPTGSFFHDKASSRCQLQLQPRLPQMKVRCSSKADPSSVDSVHTNVGALLSRRSTMGLLTIASSSGLASLDAIGAGLPPEEKPKLCDDACEKELENIPMVTTESGLQFKDIKIGEGPSPPVGFQELSALFDIFRGNMENVKWRTKLVAANYVAMVPSGQIFDSSLEKGLPYIFRVGSGQVIKGLDEGILTMKVGGKRRLYIPGTLAFPKGLTSAPGRPRVAPNSPVVFDVSLVYVPGLDDE